MESELVGHPRSSAHLKYGEPAPLNLGRKIFLSHSGKDKNFVRFLHKELCKHYNYDEITFYDEESLPKATLISMENILKEARESELGVLVLTNDFFMQTPNPMRELAEFVTYKVPLLPLFMMSVDEVKDKGRRVEWEEQWRKWPIVDERVMTMWRKALNYVTDFSGLEYCKIATNHLDYIAKIVKEVTNFIRPIILFSEKGVKGMDRMCKIVNNMYEDCASKRSSKRFSIDHTQGASTSTSISSDLGGDSGYTLDVVGIYGFAGLGKTTLCKYLCDFYFANFNGKVCYVDLGSASQMHSSHALDRMKYMLSKLTDYSYPYWPLEISQVQNLLRRRISSMTDPAFLAIDNILPDKKSQSEAGFYFSLKFPKGSKIFITSRIRDTLEILTDWCTSLSSVVIERIPKLEFEEAMDICVHEIPELHNFGSSNLEDKVKACVNKCIIFEESSKQYHPLMLKSLIAFLRQDRMQNIERRLAEVLQSERISYKNKDAWETVFEMLDMTYKVLSEEAKTMFLDMALFYTIAYSEFKTGEWIQSVYSHLNSKTLEEILSDLENLSFISMERTTQSIGIHDLLVEFSKHKASQGSNYLVVENDSHWPSRLPRIARNVTISGCHFTNATSTLDLRNVEGVEVLHLVDNAGLQEVLCSPTNLCSLIVRVPAGTSLCMVAHSSSTSAAESTSCTHIGGGPKWVQLEGNLLFRRERRLAHAWALSTSVLPQSFWSLLRRLQITALAPAGLHHLASLGLELLNLEVLHLYELPVQSLDVKSCPKLKSLDLDSMPSLMSILGLVKLTNLEELIIDSCEKLQALSIPPDNYKLYSHITSCASLKRLTLCTTSSTTGTSRPEAHCDSTSDLYVSHCSTLRQIDGLSQYIGSLYLLDIDYQGQMEETFQDLVDLAEVDSTICKARLTSLQHGFDLPGRAGRLQLASVENIVLRDAQHIGMFISALFKAQPTHLNGLDIRCKEGADCGCDKNAPFFGPFSRHEAGLYRNIFYQCSQVRDLSSLSQSDRLTDLSLRGCTSVELWPDFATMTSLRYLNLSYTSLKEWPAGLKRLPFLKKLKMRGCTQLSAEEFTKVITHITHTRGDVDMSCAIRSLIYDLEDETRDSCSIVEALHSHLPDQLVDRFYDIWRALENGSRSFNPAHVFAIEVMYVLWCESKAALRVFKSFYDGPWWEADEEEEERFSIDHDVERLIDLIGWDNASENVVEDRTIKFVKSFTSRLPSYDFVHLNFFSCPLESKADGFNFFSTPWLLNSVPSRLVKKVVKRLVKKVVDAVCRMVRAPSVAAALGEDFMLIQLNLHAMVEQLKYAMDDDDDDDDDALLDGGVMELMVGWGW